MLEPRWEAVKSRQVSKISTVFLTLNLSQIQAETMRSKGNTTDIHRQSDDSNQLVFDSFGERLRTYNVVVNSCIKSAKWEHALSIFRQTREPNAVLQQTNRGFRILVQLPSKILRNQPLALLFSAQVTYTSALNACEQGKFWRGALQLLQEMKARWNQSLQAPMKTYDRC